MTVIFIGPTGVGLDLTGLTVRPPAQQGDIAQAFLDGATTIVLIDGYFTHTLSPWHKEILFAIARGCRVIGAGSLGALRAVECARYGAEPVGVIAGWYTDGTCTDDSEVALAHGHYDDGSKSLTVPLVNIRATVLALGLDADVIEKCRSIYYMERSWPRIKKLLPKIGKKLQDSYINQKQLDAKEAIELAATYRAPVSTATNASNSNMQILLSNDLPVGDQRKWQTVSNQTEAVDLHLFFELARSIGIVPTPVEIQAQSTLMWKRLGMANPEAARQWLTEHNVTDQQWNMFAMKLATRECARQWFAVTGGSVMGVPLAEEYSLLNPA
jgi:hypothetical protein